MHRKLKSLPGVCAVLLLPAFIASAADQPAGAEAKLREALRNTMLQLRDAQTQLANVQAAQTELEEKNKSLDAELKALAKKRDGEKLEAEKTVAGLKTALTAKDAEITQLADVVEKAKVAIEQANKQQAATEEKRKVLEEKAIALDRRVADQQAKNSAMHHLGLEILDRYEKFGLGQALAAREPFIGTMKVKFQNLVQDYSDKLAEQRIKPAPAPSHGSASPKGRTTAPSEQKAKQGGAPRARD